MYSEHHLGRVLILQSLQLEQSPYTLRQDEKSLIAAQSHSESIKIIAKPERIKTEKATEHLQKPSIKTSWLVEKSPIEAPRSRSTDQPPEISTQPRSG